MQQVIERRMLTSGRVSNYTRLSSLHSPPKIFMFQLRDEEVKPSGFTYITALEHPEAPLISDVQGCRLECSWCPLPSPLPSTYTLQARSVIHIAQKGLITAIHVAQEGLMIADINTTQFQLPLNSHGGANKFAHFRAKVWCSLQKNTTCPLLLQSVRKCKCKGSRSLQYVLPYLRTKSCCCSPDMDLPLTHPIRTWL